MQKTAEVIEQELKQFIGSQELFYQMLFPNMKYTEGVKYMSRACSALWLLSDTLAQCEDLQKRHPFISINVFKEKEAKTCTIKYEDGDGNLLRVQDYSYTDFPLFNKDNQPALKMYSIDNILLLTSEY